LKNFIGTVFLRMNFKLLFISLLTFFIILTCSHGIDPSEPDSKDGDSGISGTIYFSNWPPEAEVFLLKVVVFYKFPPGNILEQVLTDSAFAFPAELTETLPYGADSTEYEMLLEPDLYNYIAIAQQTGINILTDWRAVGQYQASPFDTLPGPVTVLPDSVLRNIDIYVDFNNLPIQPF